jgi:hypothetical protein
MNSRYLASALLFFLTFSCKRGDPNSITKSANAIQYEGNFLSGTGFYSYTKHPFPTRNGQARSRYVVTTEYYNSEAEYDHFSSEKGAGGHEIDVANLNLEYDNIGMVGYFLYFDFQDPAVRTIARQFDNSGRRDSPPRYKTDFIFLNDTNARISQKWKQFYQTYKTAKQGVSSGEGSKTAGLTAEQAKEFNAFLTVDIVEAAREGSGSANGSNVKVNTGTVAIIPDERAAVTFPMYSEAVEIQNAENSQTGKPPAQPGDAGTGTTTAPALPNDQTSPQATGGMTALTSQDQASAANETSPRGVHRMARYFDPKDLLRKANELRIVEHKGEQNIFLIGATYDDRKGRSLLAGVHIIKLITLNQASGYGQYNGNNGQSSNYYPTGGTTSDSTSSSSYTNGDGGTYTNSDGSTYTNGDGSTFQNPYGSGGGIHPNPDGTTYTTADGNTYPIPNGNAAGQETYQNQTPSAYSRAQSDSARYYQYEAAPTESQYGSPPLTQQGTQPLQANGTSTNSRQYTLDKDTYSLKFHAEPNYPSPTMAHRSKRRSPTFNGSSECIENSADQYCWHAVTSSNGRTLYFNSRRTEQKNPNSSYLPPATEPPYQDTPTGGANPTGPTESRKPQDQTIP